MPSQFEMVQEPLTTVEILKCGDELALVEKELAGIRVERQTTIAEISHRTRACEKRITELAEMIITGSRSIEVEVMRVVEKGADQAKILRLDTNKTLRYEPLTWQEKQERLFEDRPDDRPEPNQ
jgi:hypothetical protein